MPETYRPSVDPPPYRSEPDSQPQATYRVTLDCDPFDWEPIGRFVVTTDEHGDTVTREVTEESATDA